MKQIVSKNLTQMTLLAASICVASMSFAKDDNHLRIVGGTDAPENRWPWMVTLQGVNNDGSPQQKHFCGGSLINDRWVLTASHCIEGSTNEDADSVNVRIGGHNLGSETTAGQLRKVKRILQHPAYDSDTVDQDIALLELTENSAQQKIAAINSTDMALVTPGTSLSVIGWGTQSDTGTSIPANLQQVEVPLVSNATCNASRTGGRSKNEVTDNMLCAGEAAGGKDSCRGDSGGPLMVQQNGDWKQVGVVSWGVECGGSNQYGVYARVENYTKWLDQHQQHLSQDTVLDYGYVGAGVEVTAKLGVYNNSADEQTMTSLTKPATVEFANNGCLNMALEAGKSCSVDVKFKSTESGDIKGKLVANATGKVDLMETLLTGEVLPSKSFSTNIANTTVQFYSSSNAQAAWTEGDGFLRSGRLSEPGRSPLQMVVTGPTKVSFEWRASHSLADDRVGVLLNRQRVKVDELGTDWKAQTINVPEGQHRVTWVMDMGEENVAQGRHLQLRKLNIESGSTGSTGGSTGGGDSSGGGSTGGSTGGGSSNGDSTGGGSTGGGSGQSSGGNNTPAQTNASSGGGGGSFGAFALLLLLPSLIKRVKR